MLSAHYKRIAKHFGQYERHILRTRYPRAAVLLPLIEKENGLHVVFTQRAEHLNLHKGEVAFPGGKFDQPDGDLCTTALRESHEEVGLDPCDVTLLGQGSDLVSSTGIQVTPFIGALRQEVQLSPNLDELQRIFTVPVEFFLQSPCETLRFCCKGMTFHVPRFQFQQYDIWGLTALILVEFLNISFDAGLMQFKPHSVFSERVKV